MNKPIPHSTNIEEEMQWPVRRLFCTNYDGCLDHAIERNWPGFSCVECRVEEPVSWEAADLTRDANRCKALIACLESKRASARYLNRLLDHFASEDEDLNV